jgi:hypothetical protein
VKSALVICTLGFLLFACHSRHVKPKPQGEFAFLLQYNGRNPNDVGFITNHVVERRLANLLKDSFQVFISKTTAFAAPVYVDTNHGWVISIFNKDSLNKKQVAAILIDVNNDAMWVDYMNGDSIISFADNTSIKKPEPLKE